MAKYTKSRTWGMVVYPESAPENWQEKYISTYATAHPWEDWAETWAHYLHIMDTLETAFYGGLRVDGNGKNEKSLEILAGTR